MARAGILAAAVAVIGVMLTWTYLGMRAVMDIGGACATGGPYVPVQPCPQGASVMLSVAIPVLLLATFAATALAVMLNAPTLLIPMWVLLFGSLGWNFLEYAFAPDGLVVGWLVCGIMFELMALPALLLIGRPDGRALRWWLAYAVAGAAGLLIGLWSFRSWA